MMSGGAWRGCRLAQAHLLLEVWLGPVEGPAEDEAGAGVGEDAALHHHGPLPVGGVLRPLPRRAPRSV